LLSPIPRPLCLQSLLPAICLNTSDLSWLIPSSEIPFLTPHYKKTRTSNYILPYPLTFLHGIDHKVTSWVIIWLASKYLPGLEIP
jgi:hypothetical protein